MTFISTGPRMQSRRADNIGRQKISNVAAKLTNNLAQIVFLLFSVMTRLSDLMKPSEKHFQSSMYN